MTRQRQDQVHMRDIETSQDIVPRSKQQMARGPQPEYAKNSQQAHSSPGHFAKHIGLNLELVKAGVVGSAAL